MWLCLDRSVTIVFACFLPAFSAGVTQATTGRAVQARLDADIAAGRPVIVHVVVALCDNENQGIVPVSATLGNGQDPANNLYWGALYGVRSFLSRVAGWGRIDAQSLPDPRVLDRVILYAQVQRHSVPAPVYVVADAWDGACIRDAVAAYTQMTAGHRLEQIEIQHGLHKLTLHAGGAAHLLVYVGHNGLMDFSLDSTAVASPGAAARSAAVLACASKFYFLENLEAVAAHPLLLTTGLMAPEAYTLDALIRHWVGDGETQAVIEAAATAYNRYQRCGLRAARRLFWGAP